MNFISQQICIKRKHAHFHRSLYVLLNTIALSYPLNKLILIALCLTLIHKYVKMIVFDILDIIF